MSSRIDVLMEEEAKEMGGGRRGKDSRKVGGGNIQHALGWRNAGGKVRERGSMDGKKIGKGRKEDF